MNSTLSSLEKGQEKDAMRIISDMQFREVREVHPNLFNIPHHPHLPLGYGVLIGHTVHYSYIRATFYIYKLNYCDGGHIKYDSFLLQDRFPPDL